MKPTRRSQPYRKGAPRPAGRALSAMVKGAPANRANPMDARRKMVKRKRLRDRVK